MPRAVFGDRIGVAVFLAIVSFVAVYWRIGFFINDSYTIANTLLNVADGHLAVKYVVYGPDSGATPGMGIRENTVYGRHYGLVVAALPFLWAWRAITTVADPRIAAVGLWALGVLGLATTTGRIVGRERVFTLSGSVLALGLFVVNVAVATPLNERWVGMFALQTSTVVWAGLLGVFIYRLLDRIHGRRVGTVGGLAVVLATPIGFWASIPKRHVLVSLLVVLVAYTLYRARESSPVRFRAASYALVGLCAWVTAFDAALLFVAFVPVDLLTARANGLRRLAVLGIVFAASLLPFVATNLIVTGNPLHPPGLLSSYRGQGDLLAGGTPTGDGGGGGNGVEGQPESTESDGGAGRLPTISTLLASVVPLATAVVDGAVASAQRLWTGFLEPGLNIVRNRPVRLYQVFIRSGYIESIAREDGGQAINLALLEAMPLAGTLLAAPVASWHRRSSIDIGEWLRSPRGAIDLFAVAITMSFTLGYLRRLPLHAMVTVRYLLPVMPLLLYLVVRLPVVRAAIEHEPGRLVASYAGTVLVGGQLLVIFVAFRGLGRGEAIQLHALLALAAVAVSVVWLLGATLSEDQRSRSGAVVLGATAGLTTVFLLLSGLEYFAYAGDFLLPAVQQLGDMLTLV